MNTYGDDGNVICLKKRALWRGIEPKIKGVTLGDQIDPDWADIYFFGGGQDKQQIAVSKDLVKVNSKLLKETARGGAVIFSICGGYQLLGHYYKPHQGPELKGVGLIDVTTLAGSRRMIQNVVLAINPLLEIAGKHKTLVGFENHSGKTFLGRDATPLGEVILGGGNNGEDKTEGAFQGNVFGCYLHGSCLPKNPHFADFLIQKALKRRYGIIELKNLDDDLEWQAHEAILEKFAPNYLRE